VAEEEATGRQPASAKTANLTAYLPWPFHTVLNSTVSSRPVGINETVVLDWVFGARHKALDANFVRVIHGFD
jgi:hypothetical protein